MSNAISSHGVKLDQMTITALTLAEKLLGFTLSLSQGSFNSGVSASAGTHDGGGAMDVRCVQYDTATKVKVVYNLRRAGFAAWHRPYNWDHAGGGEHIHCIKIGDPLVSSGAASQLRQWAAGTNGLASHASDSDSIDVKAGRPAVITAVPVPPAALPVVSLAHVVAAAKTDPTAAQGHTTYKADVLLVEQALAKLGLLSAAYADGSYGTLTVTAYAAYQRRLGYTGTAADGIPGATSLARLGKDTGLFTTTS